MEEIPFRGVNVSGHYSGNVNSFNVMNVVNHYHKGKKVEALAKSTTTGPYWMVPYSRNRNFAGREGIIDRIQKLAEDEARHSRIALCGLGGSGKTEIALEYVYRKRGQCHIFWVHGSEFPKFSEDYEYILECAGVRLPVQTDEKDEEEVLFGVREWLESPNSGNWILVLDNADNEENFKVNKGAISKFVPQGSKGTVIFTTRSRQVAHREGCTFLEVGGMAEEESRDLLLRRIDNLGPLEEKDKSAVDMLVGALDHLPLAVAGAAAFMTETSTWPYEYWEIFREDGERKKDLLLRKFREIHREADMTESILSTHFTTFDQLKQQMPTAANLLHLISFFDHQNIPEDLLLQCGLPGIDNPVDFRMAIGALMGFSLVTRSANKLLYELHRLVQQSVQVYLSYDETSHWREVALEVIWRVFPDYDYSVQHVCAAYLPHALLVTQDSEDAKVGLICYRMAHYLLEAGYYSDAEVQIRRCIALRGDTPEDDPEQMAETNLLARVLQSLGKYQEVENISRRELEIREKALGPQHPDTLTTINHLAVVLQKLGKYDEAERMHRRALEGTEQILGSDHITTLARVDSLAWMAQDLGKYDEAEEMHRRAADGCEKGLGSEHPETLSRVYGLASVLRRRGKWCEAVEMFKRLVEGREKTLGPEHPDTLAGISGLALALRKLGEYDEVETLQRRALQGRLKSLESRHPDSLASINDLGVTLKDVKLYDEAADLHQRALAIREEVLGSEHPDTLTSLSDLALALQGLGKNEEAEKKHRAVLKSREKILGRNHHDTIATVSNLASVLDSQGNRDEAAEMFRRALEGYENELGPDHPDTFFSLYKLASVPRAQGNYSEEAKLHRHAVEIRKRTLGPEHHSTRSSITRLAKALQSMKNYEEAEKLFRRVWKGNEETFGAEHPQTIASLDRLAAALQERGKREEARKIYRQVFEMREKNLGPDHPSTLTSGNNLALILQDIGMHAQSEAVLRRVLEGWEKELEPDDPKVINSVFRLGVSMRRGKNFAEAEKMFRRALEGYEKVLGPEHPETLLGIEELAVTLENLEKRDEAEQLYQRLLGVREQVLGPSHRLTLDSIRNLGSLREDMGRLSEAEQDYQRVYEGLCEIQGKDHPDTTSSLEHLSSLRIRLSALVGAADIENHETGADAGQEATAVIHIEAASEADPEDAAAAEVKYNSLTDTKQDLSPTAETTNAAKSGVVDSKIGLPAVKPMQDEPVLAQAAVEAHKKSGRRIRLIQRLSRLRPGH